MADNKVFLAVIETVSISAPPYLLYLEHATPILSFISALAGAVYISIKAIREARKQ